ncbi:agamous-like MADS-box protein TM6 isoform X1 [Euphorbia lathyris]|uniref:agamous-like MADS-box protein TM6 isoform X1 n=1 Tax=Euphorbia lathyris TaxID=212925 RepID=UPI003314113C
MKKIDNAANMEVTFSKRRSGIFKQAEILSLLSDAQISLIMCFSNNKFYDFVTPNTTHKEIFHRYQKASGVDLWQTQYQKMQEELRNLRDTNNKLGRAIRQRMGKDLHDMRFDEIFELEQTMISALDHLNKEKVSGMENEQREMINMEGDYLREVAVANPNSEYGVTHLLTYHGHVMNSA